MTTRAKVARHGTPSGYNAHQNKGERPCDACYRAKSEYDANLRAAPENTRKSRLRAKAQTQTYQALAHKYKSEYDAIYDERLAALAEENGVILKRGAPRN